jgi:hypothetical protein
LACERVKESVDVQLNNSLKYEPPFPLVCGTQNKQRHFKPFFSGEMELAERPEYFLIPYGESFICSFCYNSLTATRYSFRLFHYT